MFNYDCVSVQSFYSLFHELQFDYDFMVYFMHKNHIRGNLSCISVFCSSLIYIYLVIFVFCEFLIVSVTSQLLSSCVCVAMHSVCLLSLESQFDSVFMHKFVTYLSYYYFFQNHFC